MRKAFVVASRDYRALVANKTFVFSLLLPPVFLLIAFPFVTSGVRGIRPKGAPVVLGVVDPAGRIGGTLERLGARDGFQVLRQQPDDFDEAARLQLAERVRAGDLVAFLEVTSEVPKGAGTFPSAVLYTAQPMSPRVLLLRESVREAVQLDRLQAAGIDADHAAQLLSPIAISIRALPGPGGQTSTGAELVRVLVPFFSMFLVFMAVVFTAPFLAQAVVQEKQQRIAELLVGSLSPFELMLGKLLAGVAAGLTMLGVYGLGILGLGTIAGYLTTVPLSLVALLTLNTTLALVLFGAIFLALGAAANDVGGSQGLATIAMVFLIVPLVLGLSVVGAPDAPIAVALSLFPLSAPLVMPLRVAASASMPGWQLALSAALAATTAVAIVWAAGRVFRIGLLAQGRAPSLRELARWVAHG